MLPSCVCWQVPHWYSSTPCVCIACVCVCVCARFAGPSAHLLRCQIFTEPSGCQALASAAHLTICCSSAAHLSRRHIFTEPSSCQALASAAHLSRCHIFTEPSSCQALASAAHLSRRHIFTEPSSCQALASAAHLSRCHIFTEPSSCQGLAWPAACWQQLLSTQLRPSSFREPLLPLLHLLSVTRACMHTYTHMHAHIRTCMHTYAYTLQCGQAAIRHGVFSAPASTISSNTATGCQLAASPPQNMSGAWPGKQSVPALTCIFVCEYVRMRACALTCRCVRAPVDVWADVFALTPAQGMAHAGSSQMLTQPDSRAGGAPTGEHSLQVPMARRLPRRQSSCITASLLAPAIHGHAALLMVRVGCVLRQGDGGCVSG